MTDENILAPCWSWPNADGSAGVTETARTPEEQRYSDPLLNEREKTHGDWPMTAATAQSIKVHWQGRDDLSASQREALDMIATKIARILCGNADEPDHWKDVAGCATLVAENLGT